MEEVLTSQVSATAIAGYGSLIFSVLVGIAIVASFQPTVLQAGLGGWLAALMIIGIIGATLYPISVFLGWADLDGRTKLFAVLTGLLGLASSSVLTGYYYMYFRNRVWSASNIETVLPPDIPLVPD